MLFIFLSILVSFSISQNAPYFDGEKAYSLIKKQCSFGPRNPGSQSHDDFKDYLVNYLNQYSDSVIVDTHIIEHPYKDSKVSLYNIFARYNIHAKERILLMAHWDTREIADMDQDTSNYNKPILGANDGASGVALLMVFSEILSTYPLNNLGIDLLFVDGEDIGRHGELENFCLGTKLFSKSNKKYFPKLAICLDMVGDIDPSFKIEYYSYVQARNEVFEIWDLANEMGYDEFSYQVRSPIYDDHRALFLATGIPSLDIIDFEYPFWHTIEDTHDKCSAKTLSIVGTVVSEYIYRQDKDE